MISKEEFLEYKLETERRFNEQDRKILILQHELEKAELLRQIKSPAPIVVSEEEKAAAKKEAEDQQRKYAEWTEDPDTLAKLGIGVNGNG